MSRKFKDSGNQTGTHQALTVDTSPTDASNYVERWPAFAATHGGLKMIRRRADATGTFHATEARWFAWMTWMQGHGIPTRYVLSVGVATVPADWPEDFDPRAEPSDRDFRFPSSDFTMPQRRAEIAQGLRDLSDSIDRRNYDPRRKDNPMPKPETPTERLERLRANYAAAPLAPSSDLAARFAAPREEPQF